MTNLLHRLARRTLGAQRTVRPVTPPLFLPVRQEAAAAAAPSTTAAQTAAPRQPRPRPPAPRATRAHRRGLQPRSRHRESDAETSSAAPAPKTQTRPVTDPPLRERVISHERPAPDAATPEFAPTIEPTVTAARATLPQTEVRTVIESAEATTPIAAAPSTRAAEPARTSLEPPPPPQRAAPAAARPRTRRQQEATPPPTIEVTIGRIDIRTQPTPAPRPARKPRQTALTLEAYAAERKAGRR